MNAWHRRAAHAVERVWYGASAWRWALWPLSALFRALVSSRAAAYRGGVKRSVRLPVPVVVVGNVTVGGTGKTPFVIWLARELAARGHSPGIVTRGYRGRAAGSPLRVTAASSTDDAGDEPVLLAARTARPVVAAADRVAAAEALLDDVPGVDVLLSDDGLQHYRLARAFEIAVVDAARGFGNGLCLPAGPLREPVTRLATVDAVVVNDGSGVGPDDAPAEPRSALRGIPGDVPRVPMRLAVTRVYRIADGIEASLDAFAGRTVHAVAGIGHPERFFRMLERAGIFVLRHPLPDHAPLRTEDLPREPAVPVLVTEKDAVKLRGAAPDDVWCVTVDAVVGAAEGERLVTAIEAAMLAHARADADHRTRS
ncbi:MAG TPA: tetraacyldisaccharide 4'-kinase [Gammaproteobacteria bacterium]